MSVFAVSVSMFSRFWPPGGGKLLQFPFSDVFGPFSDRPSGLKQGVFAFSDQFSDTFSDTVSDVFTLFQA